MKTLLSIIAALALLVAFSMPAMANDDGGSMDDNAVALGTFGSAVAQDDSNATDIDVTKTDINVEVDISREYDDDNNAVATSDLKQVNVNMQQNGKNTLVDGDSGKIKLCGSIDDFAGIANVNLNTGAMNNQAIQNTIATSINDGSAF